MESLGQVGDLRRAALLEALVDGPGIAAGFADQRRDAYVAELHRTARGFAGPDRSKSASTNIATPSLV
jgi:hypothetical protein